MPRRRHGRGGGFSRPAAAMRRRARRNKGRFVSAGSLRSRADVVIRPGADKRAIIRMEALMNFEISASEQEALIGVLQDRVASLRQEIYHTETQDYKDELKKRK